MKKDLSELSDAYYAENEYYEIFSVAEDYPQYIDGELANLVKNKVVLDAGCGTGKYLAKLQKKAKLIYGIDASQKQLDIAKAKVNENVILACMDLSKIDFTDNYFDVIYSTWVLGTITAVKKRKQVLNELMRILKPGGKLILVENNIGGEFEVVRGRFPNIKRTNDYNKWLIKNGFKVKKELNTYFKFNDSKEAYSVFRYIYGEKIAENVKEKLEHKIIIFEKIKVT